jgi:Icc-related predicted phosphoesterase
MRIVAISDTHSRHEQIVVPAGDVLVHAGDITLYGKMDELRAFNHWLGRLPHKHKIVIAGNHDRIFHERSDLARSILTNAIYLQDEAITIEGIKFYGSPWQPWHHDMAFNLQRGPEIAEIWSRVPLDTDVLITHGPPFGHGDMTFSQQYVGCEDLLRRIEDIKPRLNIFGHIHEGAGITFNSRTAFINACICNLSYHPVNMPVVYDLDKN